MALPEPEKKETLISEREKIPLVERRGEISPEASEFVDEVKTIEEIKMPQPIEDEEGEIIAEDVIPKKVVIELPLTEAKIAQGFKEKITESRRWLATLFQRLLKITRGKFIYRAAKS